MNHLVIGMGEIGTAMKTVLEKEYCVEGRDIESDCVEKFDVMHICFPYFIGFEKQTEEYKNLHLKENGLLIIHSTVPAGTSKACNAVHSPVRGIHPHLVNGILTFVKYFGGERAVEASVIFEKLGIKTKTTEKSETTEALKLWETTIYAWNVILEKEINRYCEKNGLDFNIIYKDANQSYNDGYEQLGRPEYKKYVLKHMDGPIGGHCLIPNAKLLDSWICDTILSKNNEY